MIDIDKINYFYINFESKLRCLKHFQYLDNFFSKMQIQNYLQNIKNFKF